MEDEEVNSREEVLEGAVGGVPEESTSSERFTRFSLPASTSFTSDEATSFIPQASASFTSQPSTSFIPQASTSFASQPSTSFRPQQDPFPRQPSPTFARPLPPAVSGHFRRTSQELVRQGVLALQWATQQHPLQPPTPELAGHQGRMALLMRIEAFVLELVQEICPGINTTWLQAQSLWNPQPNPNIWAPDAVGESLGGGSPALITVLWQEARATRRGRLAAALLVLKRTASLLRDGSFITRREFFYAHLHELKKQQAVDVAVFDAASVLNVHTCELRILPSSRGLIAGPIVLYFESGWVLNCNTPGGTVVPSMGHTVNRAETSALFFLVVEKDAVFQRLLQEGITSRLGPCILVTGKGYPDMLVRLLLRRLWNMLQLPVFLLTDANPHGIAIMNTYRWGSQSMSYESNILTLPAARWLGVWPSEVVPLQLRRRPLSSRDYSVLRGMATRDFVRNDEGVLQQIHCQMANGFKSEIEDVAEISSSFLIDMYLASKIANLEVL